MGFAVVDSKAGGVYFVPRVEAVRVLLEQEEDPVQRRVDSRLLILSGAVIGAAERMRRGRFYYEWQGSRLQLLRADKAAAGAEAKWRGRPFVLSAALW